MKLHTAGPAPDWEKIAPAKRTAWQRMAARSNGLLAPANVVTFGGGLLVLVGLYFLGVHRYELGLGFIAVGRAADVFDGWVAEITGTKSPLGEKFDATTDKITTFLTLIALPIFGLVPLTVVLLLALPQIVATVTALIAINKGVIIHPSRIGKFGMAASWLSLFFFVGAVFLPATFCHAFGYIFMIIGIGLASAAIYGYWQAMQDVH